MIVRRDLASGEEVRVAGDMEGLPSSGEPGLSCSHGLLYAAGYGSGRFEPDAAPVPFQARDQHGMAEVTFDPPQKQMMLSTQQVLEQHPDRERIIEADREVKQRLGKDDGLTLMTYCVRWNRAGDRFLFYFGNHCVVKERGEPRLSYVFTADRSLSDIHLALDLSFGRHGMHWGWQPDNERLIGYGPAPDDPKRLCLAEVRYDGSDYRELSDHRSGGHPSVSPADPNLIVTDRGGPNGHGAVEFIQRQTGDVIRSINLPKYVGNHEPPGRNALRVCHHPVFNHTGDRVLCNTLRDGLATLTEVRLT